MHTIKTQYSFYYFKCIPLNLPLLHFVISVISQNINRRAPYDGLSDAKCNMVPVNCYVCNGYCWLHNIKTQNSFHYFKCVPPNLPLLHCLIFEISKILINRHLMSVLVMRNVIWCPPKVMLVTVTADCTLLKHKTVFTISNPFHQGCHYCTV